MKKKPEADVVKTTLRVPRQLWAEARYRATQDHQAVQELVIIALREYLKKGARP